MMYDLLMIKNIIVQVSDTTMLISIPLAGAQKTLKTCSS